MRVYTLKVRCLFLLCSVFLCGTAFAADAPVAVVGKQAISRQDLDARTAEKLKEQDANYRSQLHQLKFSHDIARQTYIEEELGKLVDERVLALESASKKTTAEALTKAVKTQDVTGADVRKFYESNKQQIDQPYEAVEPEIKEYLQKQASSAAQRRYLDSLRVKYQATINLEPARVAVTTDGPDRGRPGAPVAIVEFSDFQCPFCGKFEPIVRSVLKKYPNQVRLVYKHLPLVNLHPFAVQAAQSAVCAQEQGKFWEMHDLMFQEQSALSVNELKDKAKRLGLNTVAFDTCLDSAKANEVIGRDVVEADELGITATPTSFVNGRLLKGAISADTLSAIIDDELRRAALTTARR